MVKLAVNLLPWRQKRRDRLQAQFIKGLGGAGLVAVMFIVIAWQFYQAEIGNQVDRNRFLTSEIDVLDNKIREIRSLQQKRKELLDRMRVIQELQGNRPVSVRLFDELARQLSDQVFFENLSLKGDAIDVTGVAKDNTRISEQLRNFENSAWFAGPNVTSISALPQAGPEASRFSLSVKISAPGVSDDS